MKNKLIKFIAHNRLFKLVAGGIYLYVGLGWIGIIEGWSEAGLIGKVIAGLFILMGGVYIISFFQKK